MTLTQAPRSRRQDCPLHVELLENRCLLTGASSGLTTSLIPTPDPGLPAVVMDPAPLALTTDDPAVSATTPAPAADGSPDTSGDQAASGSDPSLTLNDPSLFPGDSDQAATAANVDASAQAPAAGDPVINPAPTTSTQLGPNPVQPIQNVTSIGNPIVDQPIAVTPIQGIVDDSLTVVPVNLNGQQGNGSGSGTDGGDSGSSGGDSGSSGGDSGTTTTGDQTGSGSTSQDTGTTTIADQGTEANTHPSDANTGNNNTGVLTGPEGPDPAKPVANNPAGANTNTGNNAPADPGASQPVPPTDPASAAAKLPDVTAQRLPLLSQTESVKTTQKALVDPESHFSRADIIHPTEARETGESAREKTTEGAKGNFTAEEQPPPATETEEPSGRAEDTPPGAEELVNEPMESPAPARALPSPNAILLASAAPFDLPALEKGVQGFFAQLEQVGEQIVAAQDRTGVSPWLVALATAGVALEVARRKLKSVPGEVGFPDEAPDPNWNWLAAPDPS